MEADVKIKVRFKYGIGRSITTKKFGVLALKWISYGHLKCLTSEVEVKREDEVKIEVRFK